MPDRERKLGTGIGDTNLTQVTDRMTALIPAIAPGKKLLPDGNVAIVRRHTDNPHRIFFSVEIGEIWPFPYPRGPRSDKTAQRTRVLGEAHEAISSGEITDEFVVGRRGGSDRPFLIGIRPIDPERRVLTVEAPKDADGRLGRVTLRVPGNRFDSVKLDAFFLETLGDIKNGTVFNPIVSQFFYDIQQGQFPSEPKTSATDAAV
jgi:hypothetical protein